MKARLLSYSVWMAGMFLIVVQPLRAQVGGSNPNGAAGAFNPRITTGCEIDPFTANATRRITDISIAGSVGTIPLALTRIYNSRGYSDHRFGVAGNWSHNYAWSISDSDESTSSTNLPSSYSVNFPDGGSETFSHSASDIYYRTSLGLRERFIPLTGNPLLGYLVLADGSKVEFRATQHSYFDIDFQVWYYYYTYTAQALIDPHGLRTTFTYNGDGTLQKMTEPAGRYLQFYYTTIASQKVIDHVTGSDGRTVQYYYIQSAFSPGTTSYVCLDHVIYFGDSQWTATYRYQAPNGANPNGIPLLWKADDPMYEGPMRRIAYTYRTTANPDGSAVVVGEIQSENYYDGTNVGVAVSTLTVGAPGNSNIRTETRGDGRTRTFTYTGYNLTSSTDFYAVSASQTYDSYGFVNSITDRNGHTTNFTNNWVNGALSTTTFPATADVTPLPAPRGVVSQTYGNAGCADANNHDNWNPYYVCTSTDEAGHVTQYSRDTNKRVTRIDYADGGYETFTYNSFGEVLSHRLKTGGTETFSYDGAGSKMTYRDPYHASGNPSAWYNYDPMNRVSTVEDTLGTGSGDPNHTTGYAYNSRSQLTVTTLPKDPTDQARHTITNAYNADGTLQSKTDQLGHVWSYIYDDYRRLKSATTAQRATGDNTARTTYFYYDATGTGDDYRYTDSGVTYVSLPSTKKIKTVYDYNRRKSTVTAGYGTTEAATTSYGYDSVGNVTSVKTPKEQPGQPYAGQSTVTAYDERNRVMSVADALGHATTIVYDTGGHQKKITRPNNQTITYDTFDLGNRVTQQTVTQTPEPNAITQYTYYTTADGASAPVGLLKSMRDPKLIAAGCLDSYGYSYDLMGRKSGMTYPAATCGGTGTNEAWHYDTAGRNNTFTNRQSKVQTLTYDALNRLTQSSWNDSGLTPTVTYGYDVASRLTAINNANAAISRVYFNDNLLKSETQTVTGSVAKAVGYTYDADGNRKSIGNPGSYTFNYTYTERNQLKTFGINPHVTYSYDLNGNLSSATLLNGTSTSYTVDELDRVTNITHSLVGTTRTLDYGYDNVSNRTWTKRDGGTGDVFGYDLNDQADAVRLDIANPDTTSVGPQTIVYDANGNRTTFSAYGPTDTYVTNNLNQYSSRNANNASYDMKGSMLTSPDPAASKLTATYDSQNRVLTATKTGGGAMTFKYDGLNRQVIRIASGVTTYNVYDGWNLIEECDAAGNIQALYAYGAAGLLFGGMSGRSPYWVYYYQNGEGSTSHLADTNGSLKEWYRYDLHGTPFVNGNSQVTASAFGIRHLFTGQQWYSEMGLYDLRNRFYSPDIGRFIQPDPIGFDGDATNQCRYCGNNPENRSDPSGLIDDIPWRYVEYSSTGGWADAQGVHVTASYLPLTAEEWGGWEPAGPGDITSGGRGGGSGGGEVLWDSITPTIKTREILRKNRAARRDLALE